MSMMMIHPMDRIWNPRWNFFPSLLDIDGGETNKDTDRSGFFFSWLFRMFINHRPSFSSFRIASKQKHHRRRQSSDVRKRQNKEQKKKKKKKKIQLPFLLSIDIERRKIFELFFSTASRFCSCADWLIVVGIKRSRKSSCYQWKKSNPNYFGIIWIWNFLFFE